MAKNLASVGILSSFPPTQCGLATFTLALGTALRNQGLGVGVVRVLDRPGCEASPDLDVVADLVDGQPASLQAATGALNGSSFALVQHEYGLYSGADGDAVLEVLSGLSVPTIAILHTVLPNPTRHQREVLDRVIGSVEGVVVMTHGALDTLRAVYDLGRTEVRVIPHGAAVLTSPVPSVHDSRPMVLTWGLMGPGKGIEWAIDAMAELKDLRPLPEYVIAGRTHPKVLAYQGDIYRDSLRQRVVDNDVQGMVTFDNSYRDLSSLNELIARSSVVILPYDSTDQATSGVLVDAIAAGRPVVATRFPHAVELLSDERGITVGHRDPVAIGVALRRILTDPEFADRLSGAARKMAPNLSWDAVASQYVRFASQLISRVSVGAA